MPADAVTSSIAVGAVDTLAPPAERARAAEPEPRVRGLIPAFNGMRGVGMLAVLLVHFIAGMVPQSRLERGIAQVLGYGMYSMDMFFILSGFLITGILYDSRNKPHYFRNFYMRRFLRIFPLYYGVLVLLFVMVPLVPAFRSEALDELRKHQAWVWLYGVNIFNAIRGDYAMPYIDHFWSLSVEEHFYLVWPAVVWLLANKPRRLMAACLVVAALSATSRIAAVMAHVPAWTVYVLTPFRLDALCLGSCLGVLARQPGGPATIRRWHVVAGLAFVAVLVGAFVLVPVLPAATEFFRGVRGTMFMLLAGTILMRSVVAPRSSVAWLFTRPTLMRIGEWSYGIYIIHHFISYYLVTHRTEFWLAERVGSHLGAVLLQGAAGMALSIGLAALSYEFFEKRFLEMKRLYSSA